MTGEEFRANYHLQDVISEGSVISYRAQDFSKAEVFVHFLVGKEPGDGAALVESLPNLDSSRARRVRLFVEVDAVPVLVTEPLEGFTTLKDWVGKGVEEAPASPPPGEYTMLFQVPPQVVPEVPPQVPLPVEAEVPPPVEPEAQPGAPEPGEPEVQPEVPAQVDQPGPPSPPADAGGLASKDLAPEAPETSAPGVYTQLFRVPEELGSELTPAADAPSSPPPTVTPTQPPPAVAPTPTPEVAPPPPPTVASPPPASPPLPAPTPAPPTGVPLGSPPPTVASEPPQPSWTEPEPPPLPTPPPPPVQESPPGKSEPGAYTQFFGKAGPGGHPGVQGQEEKHRGAAPRDTASGEDGPVWQRWRDTPGAAGEHIPSDNYLSRMSGEGGGYSAPDRPSSPGRGAPPSPGGGWEAVPPAESGDGWRDSGRAQGGSPEPPTRPAAAPPKGSRGKGKKPSLALTILGVTLLVAVILVLVVVLTRMD